MQPVFLGVARPHVPGCGLHRHAAYLRSGAPADAGARELLGVGEAAGGEEEGLGREEQEARGRDG